MKNSLRLLALAAAIAAGSAQAASTSQVMPVSLWVNTTCAIQSVPTISVAAVGGQGGVATAVGDIQVQCTNGLPYRVSLSGGENPDGGWLGRNASDGLGNSIQYGLHDYMNWWGDDGLTHSAASLSRTGTGGTDFLPLVIYADFSSWLVPGVYSDNVVLTLTY